MKRLFNKKEMSSCFELIEKAATPYGFLASLENKENYNRIWTRDAMITAIAVLCHGEKSAYPTIKKSIQTVMSHVHKDGWIPSNVAYDKVNAPPSVSYGGPVGRIDNGFWLLIGGIFYMEITKDVSLKDQFEGLAAQQFKMSTAWEFNGKHLIYCPLSSNWADEYPMEGYVLLTQLLRYWAFKKVAKFYDDDTFFDKSFKIRNAIKFHFFGEGDCEQKLFTASQENELSSLWGVDRIMSAFSPGGLTKRVDSLAYVLSIGLGIGTSETEDRLTYLLAKASKNHIGLPCFYPIIEEDEKDYDALLSNYAYVFKNRPGHFHNGGIWPMVNGWAIACLMVTNKKSSLLKKLKIDLKKLMFQNKDTELFHEYFDTTNHAPHGTKTLCFSAAGVLLSSASDARLSTLFNQVDNQKTVLKNPVLIDEITTSVRACTASPCLLFIAGESGSGKTTLANKISNMLRQSGLKTHVMNQDDYFRIPPNQNHAKRVQDMNWVGPNEVDFRLMQNHINALIEKKDVAIQVPVLNRVHDRFDTTSFSVEPFDLIIIEGTYVFDLASDKDIKIFLSANFHQTLAQREHRNRDMSSNKIGTKILETEHNIIKHYKPQANWVIDENDTITQNHKTT